MRRHAFLDECRRLVWAEIRKVLEGILSQDIGEDLYVTDCRDVSGATN